MDEQRRQRAVEEFVDEGVDEQDLGLGCAARGPALDELTAGGDAGAGEELLAVPRLAMGVPRPLGAAVLAPDDVGIAAEGLAAAWARTGSPASEAPGESAFGGGLAPRRAVPLAVALGQLAAAGAAEEPGATGMVGLTFDSVAAAAIIPGPLRDPVVTEAARPRCELLDLVSTLLGEAGLTLERVALDVERGGQATALAAYRGPNGSHERPMPASVALALAHRMHGKVYATPRLMRRGAAGEGRRPEMTRKALTELKEEILKYRQRDRLLELAWQNGLNPDAGARTVRLRIDEAADQIRIFVSRGRRPIAVVPFSEYCGGIEQLRRDVANPRPYGRQNRNDRVYRLKFAGGGDEIRRVVTRVAPHP